MNERRSFPDWPAKRDALRWRIASRSARWDHAGPLRPAPGAVVEPEGMAARLAARTAFLRVASDVQPALLTDLATGPLDEYDAAWETNGGPPDADLALEDAEQRRLHFLFMMGMLDSTGPMMGWATRWGFPVRFNPPMSILDDSRGVLRHMASDAWGMSVAGFTLHRWRVLPLPTPEELYLVDFLTTASVAQDSDLALAATLALPLVGWDPQREDRATATKRILAELGRSVRSELGRIEQEALRLAEAPPIKRTGLDHLAWLARYQFRGESFSDIADDVGRVRQAVMEGVKDAAQLVGLPLREPTRPGPRGEAP